MGQVVPNARTLSLFADRRIPSPQSAACTEAIAAICSGRRIRILRTAWEVRESSTGASASNSAGAVQIRHAQHNRQ